MPVQQVQLAPASLIVGCGFVGRFLAAKLIARDQRVYGIVRSEASAKQLAALGGRPLLASVTQRVELAAALKPVLKHEMIDVYYLVPPGRPRGDDAVSSPREVVLDAPGHLLSQLQRANLRRMVVASSTAVYGQSQGEHVDADTPAVPSDDRGQLLLDGENVWLDRCDTAHIVRFAGLYGPGRIIGMQAIRSGAPLVGNPQAWLNLVHGEDAAQLLIDIMAAASPGRIELGSDGSPVKRIEYYTTLAKCLGAPPPRVMEIVEAAGELGVSTERLQRASSKRCDNVITCERTGWLPQYPHYRDGLIASFAAMREQDEARDEPVNDEQVNRS